MTAGSSPRLRGTEQTIESIKRQIRFIPAPAGNSLIRRRRPVPGAVHPRACGEQPFIRVGVFTGPGSSPRLRGTVTIDEAAFHDQRFIPAPAGNSRVPRSRETTWSVHPRACGEQVLRTSSHWFHFGSSPRLRGTARRPGTHLYNSRFIPAPAGNRRHCLPTPGPTPVHPRACGEQGPRRFRVAQRRGSSPRLQGTATAIGYLLENGRFIPAPAGNSLTNSSSRSGKTVHPRACGEQTYDASVSH